MIAPPARPTHAAATAATKSPRTRRTRSERVPCASKRASFIVVACVPAVASPRCRELNAARNALLAVAGAAALIAATPAPEGTPVRIDVMKLQPKELLPTVPLHTEFVVEVNRLGQVVRVRSGKSSKNDAYNAQTYGNALQAFIRKPDGKVVLGTYRLTYDYSPKTGRVRRDVALVKAGGVNPTPRARSRT